MTFEVNEQLSEGFLTLIGQFPPIIREMLDLKNNQDERDFRFLLFQTVSSAKVSEFTMDQVQTASLVEYLALAVNLNPSFFNPSQSSPADLARMKAGSFAANYLMNRYLNGLDKAGFTSRLIDELSTDAGDLMIAQIQRLQFNYNDHFKVANYLNDLKNRTGLLANILGKQAAAKITKSEETISLTGEITKNLAVAHHITRENEQIGSDAFLKKQIMIGNYPLALLFAREENPDWFQNFFHQTHKPSEEQFKQAFALTRAEIDQAEEMGQELISQALLDIKVLPSAAQPALIDLANSIKK